jgi:hypothetical protein
MLSRLRDREGIFIIDAVPVLAEISFLTLDVNRELLTGLRTHVQMVDRHKHSHWEKSLRTGLRNGKHKRHMLFRDTVDLSGYP